MGNTCGLFFVYDWYDWISILNPVYLPKRFDLLKYRALVSLEIYVGGPILRLQNWLFGCDLPTPVRKWDYNIKNDTDASIVEPQHSDLSKRLASDFLHNKYDAYMHQAQRNINHVMPSVIRNQVAKRFTEDSLYNFITTTSLAFSCSPDGSTLDLTVFNRVPEDPTRKRPKVPGFIFRLDHDAHKAYVFDENHEMVAPDHVDVCVCLSTSLLAFTHSFVHFHLPSTVALFADQLMHHPKKKDSRLAILLERHTRFNLFYNYAGHNLFTPIQSQDWTFPHCFRITQSDFNFLNISRTQHYYYLTESNQSGHNVDNMPQYKDKPYFDSRFMFHKEVEAYYDVIDNYVRSFGIEKDLLDDMVTFIQECVPSIQIEDPLTMLTTMVWQVSVLHSSDHFHIWEQHEYMAFGDPNDPWNCAVSKYVLDTYAHPFMSPGQDEELSNHVDIMGLPNWEIMCSSISF